MKGELKLVFNNSNEDCKYIMTGMIDNRTYISWSNCLRDAINILKEDGYHFNHVVEMDIITLAHKQEMNYDFYFKHNMHAVEWKLNAMINKDKKLVNNFPQDWRHPLDRKFESYRI